MRICLLWHRFNRYDSIERYTVELAEHFCKKHEVHVVTTNYEYEAPRVPDIIVHKIPLVLREPLGARVLSHGIYTSKFVDKIKKRVGFDVIHLAGWVYPPAWTYPHDIITAHGCFQNIVETWDTYSREISSFEVSPLKRFCYKIWKQSSPAFYAFERRNLKKSKKIISLTERIKRNLVECHGIPEEKIVVIPYGVNLEEFKPDKRRRIKVRQEHGIDKDEIVLIFVAPNFKKGLKYVIKALPMVRDAKLLVVGRDDPRPYRVLAQESGVLDKTVFIGFVKEIGDYYSASDIFIYPVLYESYGMVITEAMASGLPVVVGRGAGAAELITNGYDGLLLRDSTDPRDIAEKINSLIIDEKLRTTMSKNARKTAEKYSWDKIAERTIHVYEEVAGK